MDDLKLLIDMMKNVPSEMQGSTKELLSDPMEMEKVMKQQGINVELYGKRRTREQTLLNHEMAIASGRYSMWSPLGNLVKYSHPTAQIKPGHIMPSDTLTNLLPIHLKVLQPGTTHRGRLLRGQLIVDPIPHVSVQSIIEDELGDVSMISFYNVGPGETNDRNVLEMFKRGTKMAICEPFFKLQRDGQFGIRVDNFNDVAFVDRVGPFTGDDVIAWKDEGKRHFVAKQFTEAARCFHISLSKYDSNVAAVLCNISAAYRCSSAHWIALQYAVAAISVAPANFKATYRVAEALEALELFELSLHYCQKAARLLGGGGTVCHEMQTRLMRLKTVKRGTSSSTDPEVQVLMFLVEKCSLDQLPGKCSPATNASLEECKQSGNRSYRESNFSRAIGWYRLALQDESVNGVATLLANISACALSEDQFVDAAMNATAAAILDPTSVKAHYRRATALLNMDVPDQALIALQASPIKNKNDQAISELHGRIQARIADKGDVFTLVHDRQGLKEQEVKMHDGIPTDYVAKMNNLMSIRSVGSKEYDGFSPLDDRIVPFHEIYARQGLWPVSSDIAACQKKLWDAFEHARSLKFKEFLLLYDKTNRGFNEMKTSNWAHRCGHPSVVVWLMRARVGSVFFVERTAYSQQVIHSFSNQPRSSIDFKQDTTHVAIAFVDLGEVLASDVFDNDEFKLRWIGYEASEYSVAKTLVVAEMMVMRASALDILQVWFSATWTNEALLSFRKALTSVLKSNCHHEKVARILMFWSRQYRGVRLRDARRFWLDSHMRSPIVIPNFKTEADRSAMCSYMISGDLISKPDVGSVVMFSIPDGCGHLSMNESVFESISGEVLFKYRRGMKDLDIVQVVVAYLCERIDLVSKAMSNNRLSIDVRFGYISPESKGTLEFIRDHLKPSTMSWSNLCDYLSPPEFHQMASCCSQPGTRHHMSPMNWCRDVCGAFVLDYNKLETRKGFAKETEKMLKKQYSDHYMTKFLFVPPIGNPMNNIDSYLTSTMYSVWVDSFLKASSQPIREHVVFKSIYTAMMRIQCSLDMSFIYDL